MTGRRTSGFTLIEAQIALAIFSFLGVGAYQLLDSTATLMTGGEQRFAALSATQTALRLLEGSSRLRSMRHPPRASSSSPAAAGATRLARRAARYSEWSGISTRTVACYVDIAAASISLKTWSRWCAWSATG